MTNLLKCARALALVPTLGLLLAHPAAAQSAAVTGLNGAAYDTTGQNGNFSIGFNFTVGPQDVTVTALGYLDDGFGSAHRVGIFDANNILVGNESVAVTAGADGDTARASAASPTFSYTTLTTPVILVAGDTYTIVGGNYTGGVFLTGGTPITDSRITYNGSRYSAVNDNDAFQPPAYTGGTGGDFGPNFLLTPAASPAPEPAALADVGLCALGLGGLILRARRRAVPPPG